MFRPGPARTKPWARAAPGPRRGAEPWARAPRPRPGAGRRGCHDPGPGRGPWPCPGAQSRAPASKRLFTLRARSFVEAPLESHRDSLQEGTVPEAEGALDSSWAPKARSKGVRGSPALSAASRTQASPAPSRVLRDSPKRSLRPPLRYTGDVRARHHRLAMRHARATPILKEARLATCAASKSPRNREPIEC